MQQSCPFHPSDPLKVLNPDAEFGPLYCKLTDLQCKCGEVPRMKLSRSDKNFHKVFLTCGQNPYQIQPCGYFQWMHAPLWKPKRPAQPTLDRWQTVKTPVGEYFALGQKKARPQNFASGFTPPIFGETPKPAKSFEQLCDEQNAERTKHNMAPYSYDTYRRYGLGIF